MALVQNFPFLTIILALFSGPLCSILKSKPAKWVNTIVISLILVMSCAVLGFTLQTGEAYVY